MNLHDTDRSVWPGDPPGFQTLHYQTSRDSQPALYPIPWSSCLAPDLGSTPSFPTLCPACPSQNFTSFAVRSFRFWRHSETKFASWSPLWQRNWLNSSPVCFSKQLQGYFSISTICQILQISANIVVDMFRAHHIILFATTALRAAVP